MSDQDVKAISGTGTFAILPATGDTPTNPGQAAAGGSVLPPPAAKPDLERLTAKLNLASETIGRDLRFRVDMERGRSVIQVLDRDTGEVIREIPPDEADVTLTKNGFVELRLYDGDA